LILLGFLAELSNLPSGLLCSGFTLPMAAMASFSFDAAAKLAARYRAKAYEPNMGQQGGDKRHPR
jgi:hypothetical protein